MQRTRALALLLSLGLAAVPASADLGDMYSPPMPYGMINQNDPMYRVEGVMRILDTALEIIRENAASTSFRPAQHATAIPAEATRWEDITDCQPTPYHTSDHWSALGFIPVMGADLRIVALTNCKFRGRGNYIKSLSVIADNEYAIWMHSMNVATRVVDITTYCQGPGEPRMPAIRVEITFDAANLMRNNVRNIVYEVRGNGVVCEPLNDGDCERAEYRNARWRACQIYQRQNRTDSCRDLPFPNAREWTFERESRDCRRRADLSGAPSQLDFATANITESLRGLTPVAFDGAAP